MSGWWAGKVRQTRRHLVGRVSQAEREALGSWVPADLRALFEQMPRPDQRHGLDVVAALRAAGHDDRDLLLAGLLHDCGKGRTVRLWHRVAWSLGERYGDGVVRLARQVPGWDAALERLATHAERSAEMALAAGCPPRTAELIRHQAEPVDAIHGEALRLADEAA
jgi:hypothetical protein